MIAQLLTRTTAAPYVTDALDPKTLIAKNVCKMQVEGSVLDSNYRQLIHLLMMNGTSTTRKDLIVSVRMAGPATTAAYIEVWRPISPIPDIKVGL